ncbi:MAG: pyridoxamine 5'-phosphate oxidase [Planctomycetota bacterium]
MSSDALADLRRDYAAPPLREADVLDSPIDQFQAWFTEVKARRVAEPNAMVLATATPDGFPSARVVLLKGLSEAGFVFYTNHESQKGRELDANPRCELVFYWEALHRQVRVRGAVERLPREVVTRYFQSRPKGSQLGAWASRQSEPIPSREALQVEFSQIEEQHAGDTALEPPPYWGGYRVRPSRIEFWQGQPSRMHDRVVYLQDPASPMGWRLERLQP